MSLENVMRDEFLIRRHMARYVHHLDSCEPENWAALFTENGSWTRANRVPVELGGSGLPAESVRGRPGLANMVRAVEARFAGRSRHQITDILVHERDGQILKCKLRALISNWSEGPGRLAMLGDYEIDFVATENDLLIHSVVCHLLPH